MIHFFDPATALRLTTLALFSLTLALPPGDASARDPGKVSANHCQNAAKSKVRHKYGNVRVQFLGNPNVRQVSNAETGVRGKGQADTTRGWIRFHYDCVYNIRTGKTHGTSVRYSGNGGGSWNGGGHWNNSGHRDRDKGSDAGKVVGAVIGAVIAGAIINSLGQDNGQNTSGSNDGGWWSPENGVRCNSYQSACYRNGRFDANWTHRIYK